MIFCFLGLPGSGKSSVAKFFQKHSGFKYFSSGDISRSNQKSNSYTNTGGGLDEKAEDTIRKAVAEFIFTNHNSRLILDGFPRSIDQINFLFENVEHRSEIAFVYFDIEVDEALKRMIGRKREDDGTPERITARITKYVYILSELLSHLDDEKYTVLKVNANQKLDAVITETLLKMRNV